MSDQLLIFKHDDALWKCADMDSKIAFIDLALIAQRLAGVRKLLPFFALVLIKKGAGVHCASLDLVSCGCRLFYTKVEGSCW